MLRGAAQREREGGVAARKPSITLITFIHQRAESTKAEFITENCPPRYPPPLPPPTMGNDSFAPPPPPSSPTGYGPMGPMLVFSTVTWRSCLLPNCNFYFNEHVLTMTFVLKGQCHDSRDWREKRYKGMQFRDFSIAASSLIREEVPRELLAFFYFMKRTDLNRLKQLCK